ncbi:hypothetical protein [Cytobacillus gottheilii]|uniref:hypothetical protein n=1 Tax=Cytobacillus gottheilii TaxID=859144 RepID=UPI002494D4FE|nr:hypothetical protein [Cytobacillus gottheilii]
MNAEKMIEERKIKLIEQILNHSVYGEAYIVTTPRKWKMIVLNHFNKVQRGDLIVSDLMDILEDKYSVVYSQKRSLVRYPIEECLKYIAKVANKPLELS